MPDKMQSLCRSNLPVLLPVSKCAYENNEMQIEYKANFPFVRISRQTYMSLHYDDDYYYYL
jgi:hypothetical protein